MDDNFSSINQEMNQENTSQENVQQAQPLYQNLQYASKEKQDKAGLGIAAMCLGIASLFLFCTCINIPLAIVGIVLGIIQIVKYKNKGFAITGIITSMISLILAIIFWILYMNASIEELGGTINSNDFMQELFEDEDSDMLEELLED